MTGRSETELLEPWVSFVDCSLKALPRLRNPQGTGHAPPVHWTLMRPPSHRQRWGNQQRRISSRPAQAKRTATIQPGQPCSGHSQRRPQTSNAMPTSTSARQRCQRPGRAKDRLDDIAGPNGGGRPECQQFRPTRASGFSTRCCAVARDRCRRPHGDMVRSAVDPAVVSSEHGILDNREQTALEALPLVDRSATAP